MTRRDQSLLWLLVAILSFPFVGASAIHGNWLACAVFAALYLVSGIRCVMLLREDE